MPPALLGRVVNWDFGAADGAGELRAFGEIDADVEPLVLLGKFDADNLPGRGNSERNAKK